MRRFEAIVDNFPGRANCRNERKMLRFVCAVGTILWGASLITAKVLRMGREVRRQESDVRRRSVPLSVWQVVERILLSNNGRRAMASTYTGGVARCAHKAHHLGGGSLIFHWFLGVGVEKSEKIAVSRGARLRAHGAPPSLRRRTAAPKRHQRRPGKRCDDRVGA